MEIFLMVLTAVLFIFGILMIKPPEALVVWVGDWIVKNNETKNKDNKK
jgi:hypothetical protein